MLGWSDCRNTVPENCTPCETLNALPYESSHAAPAEAEGLVLVPQDGRALALEVNGEDCRDDDVETMLVC